MVYLLPEVEGSCPIGADGGQTMQSRRRETWRAQACRPARLGRREPDLSLRPGGVIAAMQDAAGGRKRGVVEGDIRFPAASCCPLAEGWHERDGPSAASGCGRVGGREQPRVGERQRGHAATGTTPAALSCALPA